MTTRLRRRDDAGFVSHVLLFLFVSALAGVLVAGLALPVVGATGLAAKSTVERFEKLPRDLEIPAVPQRSRIVDAEGRTVATFYYENRISVPLRAVAPAMRRAIIAIEDSRFYEHEGVDVRGTARAFVNNQTGESVQGGSTLTQQYVKSVLLQSALLRGDKDGAAQAIDRDGTAGYLRKVRELRYAAAIEEKLTKNQILERYLNIAYFGSGAYGVEAASRQFFGKSAADLTLPQAALLAGLVKAPGAYDPLKNPERAVERRNVVLERMAQLGVVTRARADKAKRSRLGLNVKTVPNGCARSSAPFFCDYVVELIKDDPALGKTQEDRVNMLRRGGLTVTTTLDPRMQQAAQTAVDEHFPRKDPNQLGSAIVLVKPGNGAILAMAQNRTWGTKRALGVTSVNYSVDRQHGGGIGFQGGSTFKAFTAAAAIEKGIALNARLPALEEMEFEGKFKNCNTDVPWPMDDPVRNSTTSAKTATMRDMLAYSINTAAYSLEAQVTQCAARDVAVRAGIRNAAPVEQSSEDQLKNPPPSFTLGVMGVSPLRMAEAYATFAARGKHCASYAISSIVARSGRELRTAEPACKQVMEQKHADALNFGLQGVIDYGTGRALQLGRDAAGKTGTTSNNLDVWFVGYTPELSAAVWVGDPGASGRKRLPMKNLTIDGEFRGAAHGSTFAGPVWLDTMEEALEDLPPTPFVAPDSELVNGDQVTVPDVRGMSVDEAEEALTEAGLTVSETRPGFSSSIPEGDIVFTSPRAGSSTDSGEGVVLYVSSSREEALAGTQDDDDEGDDFDDDFVEDDE